MTQYSSEVAHDICVRVADGETIQQIATHYNVSVGTIINWSTKDENVEQYTRAREAAADLFESKIIARAEAVTSESAAADRVAIDALKWVAARRAPKKYGDSNKVDLTVNNLTELSDEQLDNIITQTTERLKQNA